MTVKILHSYKNRIDQINLSFILLLHKTPTVDRARNCQKFYLNSVIIFASVELLKIN